MNATLCRQIFNLRHFNCRVRRLVFSGTQCDFHGEFDKSSKVRANLSKVVPVRRNIGPPDLSSVVSESGYGSKYHPVSALEATEDRMRQTFFEKKSFTFEEWENIRTELMTSFFNLTHENFDSVLMNVLVVMNNYPLAKSFMEYLAHVGRKPNHVTYLKYMRLCSKNTDICKQEVIIEAYNKIRPFVDQPVVLDSTTVDCVVQGLCATDLWESSFEYLNKLPFSNPTLDTKNAVANAALRNGKVDLALDILEHWYEPHEQPNNYVFKQYMKLAGKIRHFDAEEADRLVEKFFGYLRDRNIIIKSALAEDISRYFRSNKQKWTAQETKVSRSGICSGCKKELRETRLTEKEFLELKEAFYEKSVKKIDVFINTTEQELRSFLSFIERNKFDIVLDGLNVAHSTTGMKNKRTLANQLLRVIEHLSLYYHRILILGRKHMREWPYPVWKCIMRKASVFFTSNLSQDDPFLIYAALASGPHTLFISSDLMRDHVSKLSDPTQIQLFRHWQLSHQVYLSVSEDNKITLMKPLKHQIQIQGSMETGWHIPYDDEFILDPYEELNNWLCLQRHS